MSKITISEMLSLLLILPWMYTAVSKLSDPQEFQRQLDSQVFSPGFARSLFFILPTAELLTVALLYHRPFRFYGLSLSLVLMLAFTIYIGLVLGGEFSRIPCACGGVLSRLNWQEHFVFNLFFVAVAATGTISMIKERRLSKYP